MDEAEFAARTIRKLVREEGYRYRDFVIIARDSEAYGEAVRSAAEKNNIVIAARIIGGIVSSVSGINVKA
jgi:ATP-dependent helicase/nuclease subunit B